MTPLEYAQDTLERLATGWPSKIPANRWAQYGRPIVTCEGAAVGSSISRRRPLFTNSVACGHLEIADITIVIARDCAVEFNEDGHTDAEKAALVSQQFGEDTQIITDLFNMIASWKWGPRAAANEPDAARQLRSPRHS